MPFHKPRLGDSTFSGRPFNPRPGIPAAHHSPAATASQPQDPLTDTHIPEPGQLDPDPPEPESAAAIHLPPLPDPTTPTTRQADLVSLSDVEHRPIDWLWQDRLASGTLAMLSGDPGSGKTWVALAIAAALSRGRVPSNPSLHATPANPAPSSTPPPKTKPPNSSAPASPKLDGDPARLVLLRGVLSAGSAQSTSLSLRDTPMLEDALERTQARLLIIDPLHSYLWAVDRHRANESGRAFDNLARLAEKHRCCILLVRHLRKRGRGLASIELSSRCPHRVPGRQ